MDEVMTIPMRVTEDSENLPMTLDTEINVVGGAVDSVNGMTGDVVLTASDVGALPDDTVIPTKTSDLQNDSGFITSVPVQSVNGQTGAVVIGNATTASAGLMSSQDKSDLGTLMADYSSALTALGVI